MNAENENYRPIPYGLTDFKRIREENYLYVDKTGYIPLLEKAGSFLFMIRPRRFGKSLFLNMLEAYYDIHWKEHFDSLFTGMTIHSKPTGKQGKYMVLKFNFSAIDPHPDMLKKSFEEYIYSTLTLFTNKYQHLLPDKLPIEIANQESAHGKLRHLVNALFLQNYKLYIMIDEYDNFANTVLASQGKERYTAITHGEGFLRLFFNILKEGTTSNDAGISRLFITGVSPLVMDDVTSGFNIGKNISLAPGFNALIGFTSEEVDNIFSEYRRAGFFKQKKKLLGLMNSWYNGYLFSKDAKKRMYNTDMVLYFIDRYLFCGAIPENLIDQNVRIDYGKLRHLIVLDQKLNGNFSHLKKIIETGKTAGELKESFPLHELVNPDNFLSLLHYFGLLTPAGMERGKTVLTIPNQTVREFFYTYLAESYKDVNIFKVEMLTFHNLMAEMAYDGNWEALFDYMAGQINKYTQIRDYIEGEKVIQGFFLAYLNLPGHYIVHSEYELNKGYADLYFEPFLIRYPDMPYSWLLELKYVSKKKYKKENLPGIVEGAKAQLARYREDKTLQERMGATRIRGLVIIFAGWEIVYKEEIRED